MPENTIPDRLDPRDRPAFTYQTASEYLRLTPRQTKRAREPGRLGCVKLGGLYVRFTQAQLDAYIQACTISPSTGTTTDGGADNA